MRGVTAKAGMVGSGGGFLLTRPMRGVTKESMEGSENGNISTHTPHARRDMLLGMSPQNTNISTHTPHARRDTKKGAYIWLGLDFYSHAPCEA